MIKPRTVKAMHGSKKLLSLKFFAEEHIVDIAIVELGVSRYYSAV